MRLSWGHLVLMTPVEQQPLPVFYMDLACCCTNTRGLWRGAVEGLMYLAPACTLWLFLGIMTLEYRIMVVRRLADPLRRFSYALAMCQPHGACCEHVCFLCASCRRQGPKLPRVSREQSLRCVCVCGCTVGA